MDRQGWRRALAWPLLAAVCLFARPAALAASGYTTVNVNKAGLAVAVQTEWINCGGYRPVLITIKPPAPSPADRNFHVEFHAKSPYGPREMAASRDIELPAGDSEVTATLLVPQYFTWQWFDLYLWEDGVHIGSLDMKNVGTGIAAQDWPEGLPNVLLVSDPPPVAAAPPWALARPGAPLVNNITLPPNPDSSSLASLLPASNFVNGMAMTAPSAATVVASPQLETLATVPLDQLPESWLAYSGIDLICLSFDQAEKLAAKHAPRWQAIRTWTVAGGNLVIYNLAGDVEKLAAIDRMLGEPPARWQVKDPAERGWRTPGANAFTDELPAPFGRQAFEATQMTQSLPAGMAAGMPGGLPADPAPANPPPQPPPPAKPAYDPAFHSRKHGLGRCVAVSTADLMAQSRLEWAGILNAISSDRWVWFRRHGVSPQRENDDFWKLPVLGVGLAPVTAFQVLITCFVVAIGPLNYWWLRRRGKLHLLVLVVPLSAAAVTLTLFGYAVAVDGLGVRVRVRSFTEIDQRRGEAACWSRIAYYAGLSPSGGLKFGDDTVVLPLDSQSPHDSQPAGVRRGLIWSQGRQELVNGWIPSRTPVQLLTIRSRATSAGLRLLPSKAGANPTIENRLASRIEELVWADELGQCFHAAGIESGAAAALEPADLEAVGGSLRRIVQRVAPSEPPGFDRNSYSFGRSTYYRWQSPLNSTLPSASTGSSLLERGISDTLAMILPGGGKPGALPPRTYVAIVSRSPETDYGVDLVEEAGSLHVVVGRW